MVFSGIVEEQGHVVSLSRCAELRLWDGTLGDGWVLVIRARVALEGAYVGCSIAVNGTCLTVTEFDGETFTVGCAPETCVCMWRCAVGVARRGGWLQLRCGCRTLFAMSCCLVCALSSRRNTLVILIHP